MGVMIINTSAKNMFKAMTQAVLRSKILFFDSNPLGRIVTRFTKDMSVIDMLMTYYIIVISFGMLKLLATVIVIAFISPIVLIPAFFASIGMVMLVKLVGPVLVETQRVDSVIRGPIHNSFGMVVQGLVSFRSMEKLEFYRREFKRDMEKGAHVTFTYCGVSRWMGQRIDVCVFFLTSIIAVGVVSYKDKVSTEKLAFTIQNITDVLVWFSFACRCFVELQNFMTSSQRIVGYTELEPEDDLEKPGDKDLLEKNWPDKGEIRFEGATMRYRDYLEPSIHDLCFKVSPGMKVGIVGRTGAGKSSIL